jgi:hypothetical protein
MADSLKYNAARDSANRSRQRDRALGKVFSGYTAGVVRTVKPETVDLALAEMRKTGHRSAGFSVLSFQKLSALMHFSPEIKSKVIQAYTEGRTELFKRGISWRTGRPIRVDDITRHKSAKGCDIDAVRRLVFSPAIIRGPVLTGRIAAPMHEVFAAVDAGVPRSLPHHIRGDVVGMMCEEVLALEMAIADIPKMLRKFIRKAYGAESYFKSLDAPIGFDTKTTYVEMLTQEDTQWA